MRSNSQRDHSVFDFNADDEATCIVSNEAMKKFNVPKNPRAEDDRLSKYDFLRCFSGDACFQHGQPGNDTGEGVSVTTLLNYKGSELDKCETSYLSTKILSLGDTCGGDKELNYAAAIVGRASDENAVNVTSDDDECSKGSSISSSVPDTSEDDDGGLECVTTDKYSDGGREKTPKCQFFFEEAESQDVIVYTDFVRYGDKLCAEIIVTFSPNHIKLEDMNAVEHDKVLHLEVAISDVNCIEWYWVQSVTTAYLIVHVSSTFKAEVDKLFGANGLAKLVFAVSDPQWFEKMQSIMPLSERYGKIWKLDCDCLHLSAELEKEVDECIRERVFGPNRCSDGVPDTFEDLVFPKGDPDAVSISKRDVELLQPDTFINDTVIDFYIKYLQSKLEPEEKSRFHFFNSFFFRKLADLDKNPGSAFEGKVAFQRVKKWTRKVDLFKKDYIFIPVNFNLHWSLMVVCHPGETAHFKEGQVNENDKVPCILHMDSIKGSHRGLKNLVQSYLWEEWKERHMEIKESVLDDESKFCKMRFIPLELPQQENSSDCGLFLLHYVELFLKEAPLTFNPFNITKFSNFLNKDWFLPVEASLKRLHVQKLIFELLEGQPHGVSPVVETDCHEAPKLPEENPENDLELLSEKCGLVGLPLENPLESRVGSGGMCSIFSCGHEDKEELGYQEFFETGPVDSNSAGGHFQTMVSMQQVGCMMMDTEDEADCEVPDTSLSSEDAEAEQELCTFSSKSESSLFEQSTSGLCSLSGQRATQPESCTDQSPSCESSSCPSQLQHYLSEGNLNENPQSHQEIEPPAPSPRLPGSQSQGSHEHGECINADDDTNAESKESADSYFSCPENLLASSNRDTESLTTAAVSPFGKKETEFEPSGDNLVSAYAGSDASMSQGQEIVDLSEDSDEPHHKRVKLTMPERHCTESVECARDHQI